jgi:hypothetical protein
MSVCADETVLLAAGVAARTPLSVQAIDSTSILGTHKPIDVS